jgi:hypothetical protein
MTVLSMASPISTDSEKRVQVDSAELTLVIR